MKIILKPEKNLKKKSLVINTNLSVYQGKT
jgi:hypothetical protein